MQYPNNSATPRSSFVRLVSSATIPKNLTNINKKINQELAPKINKQRMITENSACATPKCAHYSSQRQKQSKQICKVNVRGRKQARERFKSDSQEV